MIELRQYQKQIIDNLRTTFKTYKSPVIVLGCGGGKSVICADIAKSATDKNNLVLFLVHRIELVNQIKQTFINYGVNMDLCDISMVQSAKKLNRDYKLIITDESHHSTCKTYINIYNKFPNALRVNVTATPCRTDGRGLGETCDSLIETVSTKWLINNNYLSPYEYYSVTLESFDFTKVKKIHGEYEDLTEFLSKPKIYGDIFKYYKPGHKAICYCSSLAHSQKTAEEFNNRGIPTAHIDGNTPKEKREEIINNFRSGKISVLCNFSLISEGFDVPDCDMVFILRKTASLNLFIQMTMRCMRYKENKTAYIFDFCGNAYEHGLPDDDRKWTLDSKIKQARNISSEPDIIARTCKNCFRTYAGNNKICPYCEFDNGKTKKEIEEDKKAELQRITELKKEKDKEDLKKAGQSLESLIEYGKQHNYKPGWAYQRWKVLQYYRSKYGW